MPLFNAQGDVFREVEGLLNACRTHESLLPNVSPMRDSLQDVFNQARQIKAQQEDFEGQRQSATQKLGELLERAQELVRRLRGYVKSQLGTKNELLVQFGIAPIRRRPRSAKKQPGPQAPPSTTEKGTPETSS